MPVSQKGLESYCVQVLCACGMDEPDAQCVAEALVNADMRGIHSHGLIRVEGYAQCLLSGGVRARACTTILTEGAGYASMDANGGMGIPASLRAMRLAMKKAEKTGISMVNVRSSHHHGACGYYTSQCANEGMIGLAMSTGDIIMAAAGGYVPAIGNNPFSYAFPAGKYGIVCYDIAMSAVAAGKISMAIEERRPIPPGWLLDLEGNPTTDPKQYDLGGALLPFGGYKGYGLSMFVEGLAGLLSGAAMLADIHAWNTDPGSCGNVGHCFIAIDPKKVAPLVDFPTRVEAMLEKLATGSTAPGVSRILFPGQLEMEREEEARANGLELSRATVAALQRVESITGVKLPAEIRHENITNKE